jgi:hypothetical protein
VKAKSRQTDPRIIQNFTVVVKKSGYGQGNRDNLNMEIPETVFVI